MNCLTLVNFYVEIIISPELSNFISFYENWEKEGHLSLNVPVKKLVIFFHIFTCIFTCIFIYLHILDLSKFFIYFLVDKNLNHISGKRNCMRNCFTLTCTTFRYFSVDLQLCNCTKITLNSLIICAATINVIS